MRITKLKLRDFANKNGWLEIYDGLGEVGYVLPDGTTFVAYFNRSDALQQLVDSNDSKIDIPKGA